MDFDDAVEEHVRNSYGKNKVIRRKSRPEREFIVEGQKTYLSTEEPDYDSDDIEGFDFDDLFTDDWEIVEKK